MAEKRPIREITNLRIDEVTKCEQGMNPLARAGICKAKATTTPEDRPMDEVQKAAIAAEVAKALAEQAKKAEEEKAAAVEKAKKDAEEASKTEIQKLRDDMASIQKAADIQKQVDVAKGIPAAGNPDEVGVALYAINKAAPDAYTTILKALRAANAQAEKGGIITKALGASGSGDGTPAATELAKATSEIRKARPDLTDAQAQHEALLANPELAARLEQEE
jgi:hypothetical protein